MVESGGSGGVVGRRAKSNRSVALIAVLISGGLALAACGSSKSSSQPSASSGVTPSPVVRVATVTGLGPVLVDANGYVVYLFEPDKQGSPTCTGGCLQIWPSVKPGASGAAAGSGAEAALVGTVSASSGSQVTYNRWPLYTYTQDPGPGRASGEGVDSFGGVWLAVGADGAPVQPPGAAPTSTTRPSGGYGY